MPSRLVTVAIIAFWSLTVGWFVARDVLPHWRTGDPPPYTIELADEALRQIVPTRWTFTVNGRKVGVIRTALHYRDADDTFELTATCPEMTLAQLVLPAVGKVEILATEYDDSVRVTRDGGLRSTHTAVKLAVPALGWAGRFETTADVRNGRLDRRGTIDAPVIGRRDLALDPTDPPRGNVLNPMHPVPRVTGLRPGREWRQPLADPRSDILRALARQFGLTLPDPPAALPARVLPDTQVIEWNGEQHVCLVVEYTGDEYTARTWVRQNDGTVMRQDADAHGEALVLQRE